MSKILVVDDMRVIREPIAGSLRLAGYDTCVASDGMEALRMIESDPPDLILLDVRMPKMGGVELLKALRAVPRTEKIPVLLLTAEAEKEMVLEAAKLGIAGFVLKSSFSLPQLLARVRQLLPPGASPSAACVSSVPA